MRLGVSLAGPSRRTSPSLSLHLPTWFARQCLWQATGVLFYYFLFVGCGCSPSAGDQFRFCYAGTNQPCNGRVLTTGNFESTTEVPNVQFADLDGPRIMATETVFPSKRSTVVAPGPILLIAAATVAVIPAVIPCIVLRHLRKRVLESDKDVDATSQASLPKPFEPEPEVEQYNVFHTSWQLHAGDLRSVDLILTPTSSVSTTRQLYISNQVNRAREKVKELEELSSLLLRSASQTSNNPHNQKTDAETQAMATTPTVQGDSPGTRVLEERLQRALEEIEQLNLRMREMERQRESEWALGLSDELPPRYSQLE
ncbi:hypothetical protein FB45DRAFT_945845 [Roridomyces roridus]|uniref:Uncharacterized protein n=1 Tax=Roridomyces roridus TaxID=1738132 RepID=A0AAD7B3K2_9AGAR|nr:hypothetical protein FB45DRAFT_945845 [Roridomyces roridus]